MHSCTKFSSRRPDVTTYYYCTGFIWNGRKRVPNREPIPFVIIYTKFSTVVDLNLVLNLDLQLCCTYCSLD